MSGKKDRVAKVIWRSLGRHIQAGHALEVRRHRMAVILRFTAAGVAIQFWSASTLGPVDRRRLKGIRGENYKRRSISGRGV